MRKKTTGIVAPDSPSQWAKTKIALVVSSYHQDITYKLRDAAIHYLMRKGVQAEHISLDYVPGGYELPLGAQWLYKKTKADAVICLGCVIKGDTEHDVYINHSVAQSLQQLSLKNNKPFVFGLLTVNNLQQAKDRSGGKKGNKGEECAEAALMMLALKKKNQIGRL